MRWVVVYFLIFKCLGICAEALASRGADVDSTGDSGKLIIRNITFSGNKITKERIIRRELLLRENDTVSVEDISP
ncbi:MAG: hypothetical protein FJY07_14845, partial [Bacteroidetes bacterium]|nr:hypothetical protein [Bacteroidota bacterium]